MNGSHQRKSRLTAVLLTCALVIAGCAPSETTPRANTTPAGSAPDESDYSIPDGADGQSLMLDYIGTGSLRDLVSGSDVIVRGRTVGIVGTRAFTPGPTQWPSDAPDFKKIEPPVFIDTTINLLLTEVVRGSLKVNSNIHISETGRTEAPLMRPNTEYLLFLDRTTSDNGTYYTWAGESLGRYVINADGVIEPSTPYMPGSWQDELIGHKYVDIRDRLR